MCKVCVIVCVGCVCLGWFHALSHQCVLFVFWCICVQFVLSFIAIKIDDIQMCEIVRAIKLFVNLVSSVYP